jgi:peptidoglycan/xylan/chitin deacetylase (PgdA/CDA1 family)
VTHVVLHALEGLSPPVVARVSGDEAALRAAADGLPEGAATPEAVAARSRRAGAALSWGEPVPEDDQHARLAFCRARGASSVELLRADPALLPDLQLGSYFERRFTERFTRRLLLAAGERSFTRSSDLAAEAAFWRGVRSAATGAEWRRLTQSSYVVVHYHRVAEPKPGQERLNVSPEVFERHLRWLRRLGLRPLTADEVIRFHTDPQAALPRGAIVLCADDAFRDAIVALGRRTELRPIVFVPTDEVGRSARWTWAAGEAIASWQELQEFSAAGGTVASHARTHVPLPQLDPDFLAAELGESLRVLREHVPAAAPLLAYPHGEHDDAVCAAAAAAGYEAAFTTRVGRNGAGTDRYRLRRVGPKDWDGAAAFVWMALTGEGVPWPIERLRRRLRGLR